MYKKLFKYNLKKFLPIKLVLSQSHRQKGAKFPHGQAPYCSTHLSALLTLALFPHLLYVQYPFHIFHRLRHLMTYSSLVNSITIYLKFSQSFFTLCTSQFVATLHIFLANSSAMPVVSLSLSSLDFNTFLWPYLIEFIKNYLYLILKNVLEFIFCKFRYNLDLMVICNFCDTASNYSDKICMPPTLKVTPPTSGR